MKETTIGACVLAALLFGAVAATACTCFGSPEAKTTAQFTEEVRQAVLKAETVFSGKVTTRDSFTVAFLVDSVWKGQATRLFAMSTGAVAAADGMIQTSSCDFSFVEGHTYIVFASRNETRALRATECGFTAELIANNDTPEYLDLVAERKVLSSPGGPVSDRSRRRGAPEQDSPPGRREPAAPPRR